MPAENKQSLAPVVILLVVLVCGVGYFGWRMYNAPVDETGAGRVGLRATEILVRAGGGDSSVCNGMREFAPPGKPADDAVQRCLAAAARATSNGPGFMGVRDLGATDVDVDRDSGSVTVQADVSVG